MIGLFTEVSKAAAIEAPERIHLPIGVVGAGAIMDVAHLPAYRKAGLPLVAITDINRARAEEVAQRHGIPRVCSNLDELLAIPEIAVVDVAVPSTAQEAIATAVLSSGRHMVGQKPFAPDAETGRRIVELAEHHGVVLAVNQQLRYDEGMAAAHQMIELGWIGEITCLSITVDIWTEWSDWPWMLVADRLEISNHSIHYHDVVRWFLGDPDAVFCAGGRRPGQQARGESRTVSTYLYDSGVRAVIHANHMNDHGDNRAEFRIDGTQGAIRGTLGLLYDYPHGRPDTLEVTSTVVPTDGWVPYPVTSRWIPDAFLGPISSVLWAVAEGRPVRTSGRDNLGTLRLVDALYASMATQQVVRLSS